MESFTATIVAVDAMVYSCKLRLTDSCGLHLSITRSLFVLTSGANETRKSDYRIGVPIVLIQFKL